MRTAIIADDHPFIRAIIKHALQEAAIDVVYEASDGLDTLQGLREQHADLLILDLDMPRLGGLDVMDRLMTAPQRPKVLVLSGHPAEHYAARCMRAGAAGYLCKRHGMAQLVQALGALQAGFIYFPQEINLGMPPRREMAEQAEVVAELSPREMQVLHYLGLGMSNAAIGEQLGISNKTVSSHKRRLLEKFNVHSVIDLAVIVERHGLA
ncbi:response regulator transcription factor [Pseudomonas typographi]|uniref:response regulator transcription factor n=1 Tax=Pseudomonas typographi TaxID=2715964 RepID=UPI0016843393|nr:response regulator transcription factor [Pseudomonas typographi]MBD1589855.1 response regulator transcription factor [Pseudomonas typographi]